MPLSCCEVQTCGSSAHARRHPLDIGSSCSLLRHASVTCKVSSAPQDRLPGLSSENTRHHLSICWCALLDRHTRTNNTSSDRCAGGFFAAFVRFFAACHMLQPLFEAPNQDQSKGKGALKTHVPSPASILVKP